jgi:hypothetical protein
MWNALDHATERTNSAYYNGTIGVARDSRHFCNGLYSTSDDCSGILFAESVQRRHYGTITHKRIVVVLDAQVDFSPCNGDADTDI